MIDTIVAPYTDDFPRNSEGDVVELADGRLLLVWTEFYGGWEDHDAARICARTSVDGGATWGAKRVMQENIGRLNAMSASLLRLSNGELVFFFLRKDSPGECHIVVRRSTDEGATWSDGRQVSTLPGYHVMNNARPIQLTSGRILAPVARHVEASGSSPARAFCYLSDDGGRMWRPGIGDTGFADSPAQEPGLVQLADGHVLMVIRTHLGRVYTAISADEGDTWSASEPSPLVSPAAPSTVARLPTSGDLLIIWNNNPAGAGARWQNRTPLTAAISTDQGLTWGHIKDLEPDPAHCYAYTSITPVGDDVCLTYYVWERTLGRRNFECTSLKFRRLPVAWFST